MVRMNFRNMRIAVFSATFIWLIGSIFARENQPILHASRHTSNQQRSTSARRFDVGRTRKQSVAAPQLRATQRPPSPRLSASKKALGSRSSSYAKRSRSSAVRSERSSPIAPSSFSTRKASRGAVGSRRKSSMLTPSERTAHLRKSAKTLRTTVSKSKTSGSRVSAVSAKKPVTQSKRERKTAQQKRAPRKRAKAKTDKTSAVAGAKKQVSGVSSTVKAVSVPKATKVVSKGSAGRANWSARQSHFVNRSFAWYEGHSHPWGISLGASWSWGCWNTPWLGSVDWCDPFYGCWYPRVGFYYYGGYGYYHPWEVWGTNYWVYPFVGLRYVVHEWPHDIMYLNRRVVIENPTPASVYFAFYCLDEDGNYARIDIPRQIQVEEMSSIYIPAADCDNPVLAISKNSDMLAEVLTEQDLNLLLVRKTIGEGDVTVSVRAHGDKLGELVDLNQDKLEKLHEVEEKIKEDSAIRGRFAKELKKRGEESLSQTEAEELREDES